MFTILLLACGADPQFTVENKTVPTFVVVNKAAPPNPAVKTTCGCALTGECACWANQCSCRACRRPAGVAAKTPFAGSTPPTDVPTAAGPLPQFPAGRPVGVTYTPAPVGPFGNTRYFRQCDGSGCRLVPLP